VIVVDTAVWIGHFRSAATRAVALLRALPDPGDVIVGDLIVSERLQGLAKPVRRNGLAFAAGWQDRLRTMELHLEVAKRVAQALQVTVMNQVLGLVKSPGTDRRIPSLKPIRPFAIETRSQLDRLTPKAAPAFAILASKVRSGRPDRCAGARRQAPGVRRQACANPDQMGGRTLRLAKKPCSARLFPAYRRRVRRRTR
jgi:hypothetical protein